MHTRKDLNKDYCLPPTDLEKDYGERLLSPVRPLVVISRYQPGAQWRPESLSPGQGMLELLANTASARREPQRTLDTFKNFLPVPFLKGARGEAKETVPLILDQAG